MLGDTNSGKRNPKSGDEWTLVSHHNQRRHTAGLPAPAHEAKTQRVGDHNTGQGTTHSNTTWSSGSNPMHPAAKRQENKDKGHHRLGDNHWRLLGSWRNQPAGPNSDRKDQILGADLRQTKKDSDKVRMITDLRDLNQCHTIERHRPQTWHQVCKLLREERGQWALTLDLKGYFHHLGIHPKTRRWMRFKHNGQGYQIEAMPFGWSMSPFWAHRMSKPIRALLNQWNVPHAVGRRHPILGRDKADVCTSATRLINLLTKLGVCINPSKSMSQPAQEFTYLGHHWNLVTNRLTPLQPKVASAIQDCKHQLKSNVTTPYHLASLAGKLLDSNKSNTALTGLPQQIMRLAGKLAARTAHFNPQLTLKQAWRKSTAKTALQQPTQATSQAAPPPPLQRTLQTALQALQQPVPRVFRSSQQPLTMQTDASEKAWGATLIKDKHELATSADVWTTRQSALHITHRECLATSLALSHMERLLPPNSHLHVQTDSMATALAWKNGSKNTIMNHIVRPCLMRLHAKGIFTTAEHIPGTTNRRADWLSRNPDPKNYQLDQSLFKRICHRHNFWPTIDLFASRHNRQLQRYCSWRMDKKSQGNALQLNWAKERGWMNPPWDLIPQCLQKNQGQQGDSALLPPTLADSPLVERPEPTPSQPNDNCQQPANLQRPRRKANAIPTLANPFLCADWRGKKNQQPAAQTDLAAIGVPTRHPHQHSH